MATAMINRNALDAALGHSIPVFYSVEFSEVESDGITSCTPVGKHSTYSAHKTATKCMKVLAHAPSINFAPTKREQVSGGVQGEHKDIFRAKNKNNRPPGRGKLFLEMNCQTTIKFTKALVPTPFIEPGLNRMVPGLRGGVQLAHKKIMGGAASPRQST